MAAYVRWAHGQWDYAHEESLQSERVVRSGKDEDHIVGLAQTAKCLALIERDLPKADAMLMEAHAMARRKEFSHFAIPAGMGLLRFHEGHMDAAAEMFKESRALCKSAGARIDEYLANEYLMMIEFQRGRYQAARKYCEILGELGEKLRVGSEAPFARALTALCDVAIHDSSDALESSLEELRIADAKHRLAYTLTRLAQIDCERGRFGDAARRAVEALEHATLLERPTEMLLARSILACTSRASGDTTAAAQHDRAIAELAAAGAAHWATEQVRRKVRLEGLAS
jgi:tetratricopeptide (TPR) repeat protein